MSGDVSRKAEVSFESFAKLEFRVARIESVRPTEGTRAPCREILLDLGSLGKRVSIGQFALVPEQDLVGRKVIACCNLGRRRIGKYESQALVLGTAHPGNPEGQSQALPLYAHPEAVCGDAVF